MSYPHWLTRWLDQRAFAKQLDRNLAARKALRPARQEAARKGVATRRANERGVMA